MDGSSDTNSYIDGSVGALVWVRRRNGSWWPGRILGAEELPGSHLLSPRTGTPVKLLGREDGSVDWYNIEKSRRVKAFRCGDFDECIERAKSLASVLTKKREKYARREDAILHALELERKYAEENQLLRTTFSGDRSYRELDFHDEMVLNDSIGPPSDFHNDFMDPEESADVVQESFDSLFSLQSDQKFMDAEWEDDIAEAIPRMRGLQDFGLRITPTKEKKAEHFPATCIPEDDTKMGSCVTKNTVSVLAPVNTKASSIATAAVSKKKRSSQVNVAEGQTAYKKRDKRKPFNRGLGSDPKSTHCSAPSGATERNGYSTTILQPKLESQLLGPSDVRSLTGGSNLSMWHIESRTRHDMFDPHIVMDKECSSFSDHVKSNCCEGQPYPCVIPQVESTSLSFVDSFLQGGSGLRCSLFQGSTYLDTDVGVERGNSLPMAENLSGSLSEFTAWPNYGHREVLSESEFGLRRQITNSQPISMSDYPFDTPVTNNVLPMYPLYGHKLEENSVFAKRSPYDGDGSLNINSDAAKGVIKSSRQCLSGLEDEENGRRHIKQEDEADSFQPIPESSICSLKGVSVRDPTGYLNQRTAASDLPSFYDVCGLNEATKGQSSQDITTDTNANDASDDVTGACDFLNNDLLSNDSEADGSNPIVRWQVKGKRRTRTCSGNVWGSTPSWMYRESLSIDEPENKQEQSCIIPDTFEVINQSIKEFIHNDAGSTSEDGEALMEIPSEENACTMDDSTGALLDYKSLLVCQNFAWVDVPIEHQISDAEDDNVQLVSLVSKLNGMAVVGYPVVVEVLDGHHIAKRSLSGNVAKKSPLQPVWRTGRRTAMQRVPRSCRIVIASNHVEDASAKAYQQVISSQKTRVNRKTGPPLSASDRKRFLKKVGSSTQKTRMLSSLAAEKNQINSTTSDVPGPSVVTCIPVNVIFSRIREAIYKGMDHGSSDSDNL